MTFLKTSYALIAILTLTACATAGKPFDRAHIPEIKTGVQDKAQILAWFGEPSEMQEVTASPAGCIERWIYAGLKTKSASLVVDFDRYAKVCDHAYVEQ